MEERFNPEKISRLDYQIILSLIEENSKVLDLGCNDGTLLGLLEKKKKVIGRGIEISAEGVHSAMEKGLSVIQGNIDDGLSDYDDKSFDWVILSQTLQAIREPALVIPEMLRVGKKAIVSFPNFGHIKIRMKLMFTGKMPKSRLLMDEWYNTPNIRMLTIKDFHNFIKKNDIKTAKEFYFKDYSTLRSQYAPNLFARMAMFVIEEKGSSTSTS